ncbi:hypothetical protein PT276_03505 [Orbaceae bacterium ESL0721]|nr:hypothetical protein [Orbaceae bacterium ESL0721]
MNNLIIDLNQPQYIKLMEAPLRSYREYKPDLPDPELYSKLLSALTPKEDDPTEIVGPLEIIDCTDSDEIEPDTEEAIKYLEEEIELKTENKLNYYKAELNRLETGQEQLTKLSLEELLHYIDVYEEEIRLMKEDLNEVIANSNRRLTDDEKKSIRESIAEQLVNIVVDRSDTI